MDKDDVGAIAHEVSQIFSNNKMTFSDVVNLFHTLLIYSLDHDENIPAGTDTAKATFDSPSGNKIEVITTFFLDKSEKH